MKSKPFEQIKVSDICNEALINRSTFYDHYADKYDLLEEYINSLKDSLTEEITKENNIEKILKSIILKLLSFFFFIFRKKRYLYSYND